MNASKTQEAVSAKSARPVAECNGRACGNKMPGPGSKGIGDTAIRNYNKWKEIRVQMDTLAEKRPIDTSLNLFGKTFKYPFFAGTVGAVNLHYGDSLNDVSYNDILVSACAEFGIAAFTGDGTDSNVMVAATKAIKNAGGFGIPTVKPWNIETIREKMALVHDAHPFAVAMDIDAAGLPFLQNLNPPAGSKSVEELRAIREAAGVPFIVKGVMTVKGALKAKEAGAEAIVVSNHSGSVLDAVPRYRGSPGRNRRRSGRLHENPCRRRHPLRHRRLQSPCPGRRRRHHRPPLRHSRLRRCPRRRRVLHQQDRLRTQRTMAMCGVASLAEITRDCVRR